MQLPPDGVEVVSDTALGVGVGVAGFSGDRVGETAGFGGAGAGKTVSIGSRATCAAFTFLISSSEIAGKSLTFEGVKAICPEHG